MSKLFNNRFELLIMINLDCLRFGCKIIFVIIGLKAEFVCFIYFLLQDPKLIILAQIYRFSY
jgi:hypothetical protein